jgi:hypothetical protein
MVQLEPQVFQRELTALVVNLIKVVDLYLEEQEIESNIVTHYPAIKSISSVITDSLTSVGLVITYSSTSVELNLLHVIYTDMEVVLLIDLFVK